MSTYTQIEIDADGELCPPLSSLQRPLILDDTGGTTITVDLNGDQLWLQLENEDGDSSVNLSPAAVDLLIAALVQYKEKLK